VKLDLYHLHRGIHFSKLAYPIALNALKMWAESDGWEVRTSICKESGVRFDTSAEVVGISVYTQTAPAAYRVSQKLRERGKIVVLGGPHFRGQSTYAEAGPHCDVIVNSICEEQMRELLCDIAQGRIAAGRHHPIQITDFEDRFRYPDNFYQSLQSQRWYQLPAIPTSVGCPYQCSFCAAFMPGKYLLRSIESVRKEVEHAPGSKVFFCDATFGLNKKFTIDLMRSLAPLKKKIAVETTLSTLEDVEMLEAMALGGVKGVVVGIETLATGLQKHGSSDLQASLKDLVSRAHDLGVLVHGNFICGLEEDGPESFEEIYECFARSGMDAIMIGILTPYPDTALYRRLKNEGRIIDANWENYDGHHVVYRPRRMTIDQLIEGYIQLYRQVKKHRSLGREIFEAVWNHGIGVQSAALIGNNLYHKLDSAKKTRQLRKNQRRIAALDLPRSDTNEPTVSGAQALSPPAAEPTEHRTDIG
jgi:radical SAM superfamily enzyme YgiQ (UPF0313 family)